MGKLFFPNGTLRPGIEWFPNLGKCVYCDILFHDSLLLHHIKTCPARYISQKLSLEQKKAEIALYVFNLVPCFTSGEQEVEYFLERGINFDGKTSQDLEILQFTDKLYWIIRSIKTKKRFLINGELLKIFPDFVTDYIYAGFYIIGEEPVNMIDELYLRYALMFRNEEWQDENKNFHLYSPIFTEDGGYLNYASI